MDNYAKAIFLGIFALYILTLAPSVTFEDSGELITAVKNLGIAHPTGYPTYTLLGKLFTFVPIGNIAFRINLMSAFFGSLACFFVYLSIREFRSINEALIASVLISAIPIFWAMSIVAEVYTLNAFFISLIMYLIVKFNKTKNNRYLNLAVLFFGLGLTNHLSILFIAPAFLFLIKFPKLNTKLLITSGILFIIGLSPYLYLPIRSSMDPVLDWGNPETAKNFISHVTGEQYSHRRMTLSMNNIFPRLYRFIESLFFQFNLFLGIGILGAFYLSKRNKKYLFFLLAIIVLNTLINLTYDIEDILVYYIPSYMAIAMLISAGISKHVKKNTMISIVLLLFITISFVTFVNGYRQEIQAQDYGESLLDEIEPRSIVLTNEQNDYFVLMYYVYTARTRTDIIPIDTNMLALPWYLNNLKFHHPELKEVNIIDNKFQIEKLKSMGLNVYQIQNKTVHKLY